MEAQLITHIKNNLPTLVIWFKTKQRVQASSDILKPIIPAFKEEFPTVNLYGCPDCVLDMIGWAIIEYKKALKAEPKTKKEDKE